MATLAGGRARQVSAPAPFLHHCTVHADTLFRTPQAGISAGGYGVRVTYLPLYNTNRLLLIYFYDATRAPSSDVRHIWPFTTPSRRNTLSSLFEDTTCVFIQQFSPPKLPSTPIPDICPTLSSARHFAHTGANHAHLVPAKRHQRV